MFTFRQYLLLGGFFLGAISCSSSSDNSLGETEKSDVLEARPHFVEQAGLASGASTAQEKPGSVPAAPTAPVAVAPSSGKKFAPKVPGISVSQVSVPDKVVALTFDDGPHASLTPRLLDILKKYDAKATFFMLGTNARLYPNVVRRVAAEGHEIGSHSNTHPLLSKCGQGKLVSELDAAESAIVAACGKRPSVMRPPYGGMTAKQRQFVNQKYNYHIVLWDVDPLDWKRPGPAVVAQRLIKGARPGSILLSHDIHAGTIDAMETAIGTLKAQGYRFVTVSELIAEATAAANAAQSAPAPAEAPVLTAAVTG